MCAGDGHIEAVRVEFDNSLISYDDILDEFYKQDKQTLMGQKGQYQSAIFTTNEEQMAKALNRGDNMALRDPGKAAILCSRVISSAV